MRLNAILQLAKNAEVKNTKNRGLDLMFCFELEDHRTL